MALDLASVAAFLFEIFAVMQTRKSGPGSENPLPRAVFIVVLLNMSITSLYLPEVPGIARVIAFFTPAPIQIALTAYDFFRVFIIFLSEVLIRAVLITVLLGFRLSNLIDSLIISLAKNLLIMVLGSL